MASGGGNTLRVVLLGKTGVGKSSLGNALTNIKDKDQQFKVGRGLKSETTKCAYHTGVFDGFQVQVTDTPGLCDTVLKPKEIHIEVAKSVALAQPGPHILIFTLRCDRRFTEEEYRAYLTIKKIFSDEMDKFMIIVFNGIDCYDDEETIEGQRKELAKEVANFGAHLNQMLLAAKGRFIGMNNKASPADKSKQIHDLVNMMKKLVKQNGNEYYTTQVTTSIKKEVDVLVAERAKEKHISKDQAADQIKRDIVDEKVRPGFFQTVEGVISSAASAVVEACIVM